MIVTPMKQKDVAFESQVLVEFYKRLPGCLHVEIVDMIFFSDIMDKGAVSGRPEYLDQAYRIGIRMAGYSRSQQGGVWVGGMSGARVQAGARVPCDGSFGYRCRFSV
jgi:hypothetical protein